MTGTVERFRTNVSSMLTWFSFEHNCHTKTQIPGETWKSSTTVSKFTFTKLKIIQKGVNVFVSRSHPQFIKRIMENKKFLKYLTELLKP